MYTEEIHLGDLTLIGTAVRTNNKNEMHLETAKIGEHFNSYFGAKLADNFKDRCSPNVTYSVYTEYESDENGDYTHFIGEAVKSLDNQDLTIFKKLIIPASKYQKFTTNSGKMPDIVIKTWQNIWKMRPQDFAGSRSYIADFELYDQRSYDPNNATVDIYVGIK